MTTKILHDGLEGHMHRSLERAARRDRGERLETERILTFADPLDMLECLTKERLRLWQTVKKNRMSISDLARKLARNRGSVTRDVNVLHRLGLLRLREQVNPGHGIHTIVEPSARKLEIRLSL